jgi:magnesium-transporting ATPase (P-type)
VKSALEMTQPLVWPSPESPEALQKLSSWSASLECEESNKDLYEFEGHLSLGGGKKHVVDIKNVIWRGTTVVNTTWIFGLVFFTGQDTKLIRNSRAAPSKRSHVDKMVNTTVIIIFITLGRSLHWLMMYLNVSEICTCVGLLNSCDGNSKYHIESHFFE